MPSRSPVAPVRGRPRGATSFDANAARAFGVIVRDARLADGTSQEALAHVADVERSYLGRIERGQSQPTLFVILKIAAALNLGAGEMISLVEKAVRKKTRLSSKR